MRQVDLTLIAVPSPFFFHFFESRKLLALKLLHAL